MSDATTEALRRLPLREQHVRAGARFAPFAGWEMPLQYAGIVQEHEAVRGAAGMFDVSHMGRVEVLGPEAGVRLRSITTADVTRLRPGRARYSLYCNERGGIEDDIFVYRIDHDRWLIVHNAANAEPDAARVRAAFGETPDEGGWVIAAAAGGTDTRGWAAVPGAMRNVGLETVMLAVQGPAAGAAIARVLGIDFDAVPRRGCIEAPFEDGTVLFGRTGYTGEDGGECITDLARGPALWDAFLAAGVTPTGLGARDTLRLEAALPLHGHEITPATHPYEAGLGFAVELTDGAPFTGREALERLAGTPPSRRLACIRLAERAVPREHYPVLASGVDGREPVGAPVAMLTSGAFSPTLRAGIGMAYLPPALAEPGTPLAIDIRGRAVPAEVVPRPFYRRED